MTLPTLEDVAREAGVSRSLVSLVMRGSSNVSEQRRERIIEAAQRLGYRPNVMARNLAAGRTHTLGVMLDDLHNQFYAEIVDGLLQAAEHHGFRLLLTTGRRDPAVQQRCIEMLLEHRTDGLVIISPRMALDIIERAAVAVPTVVVADPMASECFDVISNDEAVGAKLVVRHLAGLGHREIVHVDGGNGAGSRARRNGYSAAMLVVLPGTAPDIITSEFTDDGGRVAARSLLQRDRLPTAVFTANDLSAVGLIDELDRAGVRVPNDISVVGYDNTALSAIGRVSLTTVDQPRSEMGRRAVARLIERIEHGRRDRAEDVIEPRLVVRTTTGPAPVR